MHDQGKRILDRLKIQGSEPIEIPEWEGRFRVRQLRLRDFSAIKQLGGEQDEARQNALIVSLSLTDEHGNRIFDESDIDALMDAPVPVVLRIVRAANRLGNLEQSIEDAKKNSTPSRSRPTGQPSRSGKPPRKS